MEVILKEDLSNLGHKDDIVKVKDGYARNYLIPRGYAVIASKTNKKIHDEILRQRAHKEEKLIKEAEKAAEALKNISLTIGAKTGTSNKIFGSVNAIQIADALKKQHNVEIDRKKINVNSNAIKELGSYEAEIVFHKKVKVNINFDVVAE